MTDEQLIAKLEETKNDTSISEEEKNKYLSIYAAELERQRYDKIIEIKKDQIQKLRLKIISELLELYPKVDEEKKSIVYNALERLDQDNINNLFVLKPHLQLKVYDIDSSSLTGQVITYVDDSIQMELTDLVDMCNKYRSLIDRKYYLLSCHLSDIIDPEAFNFYNDDEDFKDQAEFDKIFMRENKKINELDVFPAEKGIIRNILIDAIKYGKSYGTLYEKLPEIAGYTDQLNEFNSGNKTM